jgi:hypothetical protein
MRGLTDLVMLESFDASARGRHPFVGEPSPRRRRPMAQLEVVIACPAGELRQALLVSPGLGLRSLSLGGSDTDRVRRQINLLKALARSGVYNVVAVDAIDSDRTRVLVEPHPRDRLRVVQRNFHRG